MLRRLNLDYHSHIGFLRLFALFIIGEQDKMSVVSAICCTIYSACSIRGNTFHGWKLKLHLLRRPSASGYSAAQFGNIRLFAQIVKDLIRKFILIFY